MPKEIRAFWDGIPIDENKLFIDADSLQAVVSFIIIKSEYSKLLVDILLTEDFSTQALQMTNRAYYMTVIHSALCWIETL